MDEIIIALIGTLLCEGVMGAFAGLSSKRFFVCVVVINILTNVPLNVILLILGNVSYLPIVVGLLELTVFVVEGLFYRRYLKTCLHPFYLSLLLNGVSLLAGLVVRAVIQ